MKFFHCLSYTTQSKNYYKWWSVLHGGSVQHILQRIMLRGVFSPRICSSCFSVSVPRNNFDLGVSQLRGVTKYKQVFSQHSLNNKFSIENHTKPSILNSEHKKKNQLYNARLKSYLLCLNHTIFIPYQVCVYIFTRPCFWYTGWHC